MRALLFLVVEVVAIVSIAVGVGIEIGSGWGLVAGGVGLLVEVLAAQLPRSDDS